MTEPELPSSLALRDANFAKVKKSRKKKINFIWLLFTERYILQKRASQNPRPVLRLPDGPRSIIRPGVIAHNRSYLYAIRLYSITHCAN